MKTSKISYISLLMILFIACSESNVQETEINKKVIISGKILNQTQSGNQLKLLIYKLAQSYEKQLISPDEYGNFQTSFYSNVPNNLLMIDEDTVYNLVSHPGDSIYFEIDDKSKSIKFSGSAAKTNCDIQEFTLNYFPSSNRDYWQFYPESNPEKFLNKLDSMKILWEESYRNFIIKQSPNDETKLWAKLEIESSYIYNLFGYTVMKGINTWKIPKGFFDKIDKTIPVNLNMAINTSALNSITGDTRYFIDQYDKQNLKAKGKDIKNLSKEENIERMLNSFLANCKDPFLRELILAKTFNQSLEMYKLDFFETHRKYVDESIKIPLLKNIVLALYADAKYATENPKVASAAILNKLKEGPLKENIDTLLSMNKGKIIYIDCWAPWCGPCIGEIPNSKKLMEKYSKDDVAFLFFCIDSDEKAWKAMLSKHQLGGQHYFFNKKQSNELRSVFQITGIPRYILLDQNGNIVAQKADRPNHISDDIDKLLNAKKRIINIFLVSSQA